MKTAVVTGASGDIGRAIAERLTKDGYTVIGTYCRDEASAEALKKEGIACIQCDFCIASDIDRLATALAPYHCVDVLVNNAGLDDIGLFQDISDETLHKILQVNLISPMLLTKKILPLLMRANGRIVNISSIWGQCGASMEVAYSASKAGLIGFTEGLAAELGPSGITVNAVAPGFIDTKMNACYSDEERADFLNGLPIPRAGTPNEVADAVAFLVSPAASYITGQTLRIG